MMILLRLRLNNLKIQNEIQNKINETRNTKVVLETNKKSAENKKKDLLILKTSLMDKKKVLDITKKEKSKLLTETKNSEANYKKILDEKKVLADAFNNELELFESKLQFVIDANSIPGSKNGILYWPLNIIKITQKFGYTQFGKNVYVNGFHNGVDFRASIGTEVKASLGGVVKGIGDTDSVCPSASYGKWVFVEHGNGLSTIYGHLSLIKVVEGQTISSGDVIGYSGNTGFSTGPHLHMSVYATQGVRIMSRKSTVCKGTYTLLLHLNRIVLTYPNI